MTSWTDAASFGIVPVCAAIAVLAAGCATRLDPELAVLMWSNGAQSFWGCVSFASFGRGYFGVPGDRERFATCTETDSASARRGRPLVIESRDP